MKTKQKNKEKLEMFVVNFIVQVNTTRITADGGDSFNESFEYLKEKLMLQFEDYANEENNT